MTLEAMLTLILSPAITFVIHALICRLPLSRGISRISIAAMCSVVTAIVVASVVTFAGLDDSVSTLEGFCFSLLVTLALAHVYFHFFNMSETARRIKILLQIRSGQDPLAQNEQSYTAKDLVSVRLERLRELGQVTITDGRYQPKKTILYAVAVMMKGYEKLIFPLRGN